MTKTTLECSEQNEQTTDNPAALLSAWCGEVQCFRELEARIAALPTEQLRGRVFERFAEAYLHVAPGAAAKNVWPAERVPESVRTRFNGALDQDRGIDGVLKTQLEDLHAYQVKFRTNRPSLTWTDLATFVGLTEEFDGRLVFTNCETVASTVKRRRGLYSVTGRDLDRLTAREFQRVREWLEGQKPAFTPLPPLPHQNTALRDICTELKVQDRATAVLACGTGKTLIGCWTAQRLQAQRVLVLLPSLALVRQTLREWVGNLPPDSFVWQCVCSDETVDAGADSWMLRKEDLDFPVTTDPKEVRRFLNCDFAGTKLVFTTYQSAQVVARGMNEDQPFDLAIFDEAHRTASRQGLKFSFALTDDNLPIRKRLFMTATPRHYDVRRRTDGGDHVTVYSMDDPKVYGRVVHNLGLARAAENKIICPYKVLISVVTEAEVRAAKLRCSEVVLDGEAASAVDVANRLALARAVERFGIRKAFTFHRSVAIANAFVYQQSHGIARFLNRFRVSHVNGAMSACIRDRLLQEFTESPSALMSNARCLTEGVDVPDVDMVAFLTPKRSKVDIVQAIGRALRRSKGKECGYVFVPVLLQAGESIEAAVRRTDFDHVWEVLQALREQDTVLADCIQLMSEDVGRGRPMSEVAFAERVEVIGSEIGLPALRRAITAACVNKLGCTWDERHGQLIEFKRTHGHSNVPHLWKANPALGGWAAAQRRFHSQGRLAPERVKRLEAIEFAWSPVEAFWDERIAELRDFARIHGHCDVPQQWKPNRKLGTWVNTQRSLRQRGRLDGEQIRRLEELGFRWDPKGENWERMFATLIAFKKLHGHCLIPDSYRETKGLSAWVATLRRQRKTGRLTPERLLRLEQVGFVWDAREAKWMRLLEQLRLYVQAHGHAAVPHSWPENRELAGWVLHQRQLNHKGKLVPERVAQLEALGFVWNPHAATWHRRLSELIRLKSQGQPWNKPGDSKLAKWLAHQIHQMKTGQLSVTRSSRLKNLLGWT